MNRYQKFLAFSALGSALLTLSACSLTPPKHMMDIQAGETFELKQAVAIKAQSARVYIQNGEITGAGFNRYEPHCRIEIRELSEQKSTIQTENFKISSVRIGEEAVAANAFSQHYAMLGFGISTAFANDSDNDSARVETMDYVHLYLQSDKQPNVLRLTCAGSLSNGDPMDEPRSHRPQRDKINQILGQIGAIR